jgi:hypothetical protein
MKSIFQTLVFQLSCILIFGLIYWYCRDDFIYNIGHEKHVKTDFIDYFFMSTTVQCGVGYSYLYPVEDRGKLLLMLQQFLMISSNVLILFLFSRHLIKHRKNINKISL